MIGAYPTLDDGSENPCFEGEQAHPWWYPYWLDTRAEEACKHNRGIGPLGIPTGISLPSFPTDSEVVDGGVAVPGSPSGGNSLEDQLSNLATIAAVGFVAYLGISLYQNNGRKRRR